MWPALVVLVYFTSTGSASDSYSPDVNLGSSVFNDLVPSDQSILKSRSKRERARLTASEKCENLPAYIPLLCYGISKGFAWFFGSEEGAYIFDMCNSAQTYNAKGRRRRSLDEVEPKFFVNIKRDLTGTDHQHFSSNELQIFFTTFSSQSDRTVGSRLRSRGLHRLGFRFNSTRVCIKFIKFTARMCQFFLHKSVANNLQNFAWLCYFSPDYSNDCYQLIQALGRLCRVTLDHEDFDYEAQGETGVPINKNHTTTEPIPLNPIETCKSFTPSMFAICRYFKLTLPMIFGRTVGRLLTDTCNTYFDGLIHLIPWDWFQTGSGTGSSSESASVLEGYSAYAAGHNVHGNDSWLQGGVVPWHDEGMEQLAMEDEPSPKAGSSNNVQVSQSHRNSKHRSIAYLHMTVRLHNHYYRQRGLLDVFSFLRNTVDSTTLKVCTAFVELVAPLCQRLGGQDSGFYRWSWACFLGGRFAGPCLLFMKSAAGLCRSDLSVCDPSLSPSTFSCEGHDPGFYSDPKHPCANFYYFCPMEPEGPHEARKPAPQAQVIPCSQGPNYVYVAEISQCRKRVHVPECHSRRSPCLPPPPLEPKATSDFLDPLCDPLAPAPTTKEELEPIQLMMDAADAKRKKDAEEASGPEPKEKFNCRGMANGLYPFPGRRCSPFFFRCKKGATVEDMCHSRAHVFDEYSLECKPRSNVFQCLLPPCPANEPSRTLCDPTVPAPPAAYDPQTFTFNCTGVPHGYYPDPYDRCAQYFFVCAEERRWTVYGTGVTVSKRMTCNVNADSVERVYVPRLMKCVPKANVEHCWQYKPPCAANDAARLDYEPTRR